MGVGIACITFTNRAVDVISQRLDFDDLFAVSTIHNFVWSEIGRFPADIRGVLTDYIIPLHIEKKREDDNGGQSKKEIAARKRIQSLEADLVLMPDLDGFAYADSPYSDYPKGQIGHDDVIAIGAHLIETNQRLRRIIAQKYPYNFVDEAQDTFQRVVSALNVLGQGDGPPVVGYFGDPMQQIYEDRASTFAASEGFETIPKAENYRCSIEVIKLLNRFRTDVEQVPAGANRTVEGSVRIRIVEAEEPEGPRNRYLEEQSVRASERFDQAIESWGWADREDVKILFLVRQMIARRLRFHAIQQLFFWEIRFVAGQGGF